jgi:hypothetical protein
MKSRLNNNPDITIDANSPANVHHANKYLERFSVSIRLLNYSHKSYKLFLVKSWFCMQMGFVTNFIVFSSLVQD